MEGRHVYPSTDASYSFLTGRLRSGSGFMRVLFESEGLPDEFVSRQLRGSLSQHRTFPDIEGGVQGSIHSLRACAASGGTHQRKGSTNSCPPFHLVLCQRSARF